MEKAESVEKLLEAARICEDPAGHCRDCPLGVHMDDWGDCHIIDKLADVIRALQKEKCHG